jgi:hypothetical protein
MEEKSKQQQVFDWLLENPEELYSSDNSKLYNKFKKSDLPRNRLRSYKSRLKEKIEKGEIMLEQEESVPNVYDEFFKKHHQTFFKIGKFIGIGFFLLMSFLLVKFLIKTFRD